MEAHNDCVENSTDPECVDVPIWMLEVSLGGSFIKQEDLSACYLEDHVISVEKLEDASKKAEALGFDKVEGARKKFPSVFHLRDALKAFMSTRRDDDTGGAFVISLKDIVNTNHTQFTQEEFLPLNHVTVEDSAKEGSVAAWSLVQWLYHRAQPQPDETDPHSEFSIVHNVLMKTSIACYPNLACAPRIAMVWFLQEARLPPDALRTSSALEARLSFIEYAARWQAPSQRVTLLEQEWALIRRRNATMEQWCGTGADSYENFVRILKVLYGAATMPSFEMLGIAQDRLVELRDLWQDITPRDNIVFLQQMLARTGGSGASDTAAGEAAPGAPRRGALPRNASALTLLLDALCEWSEGPSPNIHYAIHLIMHSTYTPAMRWVTGQAKTAAALPPRFEMDDLGAWRAP